MITERDKKILKWIEEYRSITIDQCSKLFFSGNKMAYDQARKRLRYLNKEGHIKRDRGDPKSESVYYMDKKLRKHDLKIMDMIVALQEFNTTETLIQNKIIINNHTSYVIDATVVIAEVMPIIIEVDYTHYTSDEKIKKLIAYLEDLHDNPYAFIIIRQTFAGISVTNVGKWSKLIFVPWNFNKTDMLPRSLRSLLE